MNACRQGINKGIPVSLRSSIRSCAGLIHNQPQFSSRPRLSLPRSLYCNEKFKLSSKRSRLRDLQPHRYSVNVAAVSTAPALTNASPLVSIVAVVVGWLVIGGSLFRSIPQIARIVKKKSVVGLSFTSLVSELIVYTITVAYNIRFNYPFSTWGDTLMVTIQQIAIIGLVFNYNKATRLSVKLATTIGFFAGCSFLFSNFCGIATLQLLQACSALLLALGGRLPQIILNLRRGNSGELSGASVGLSVAGNLARVFTTVALVGDPIILATASSQLVLNSIILYQIVDTARRERGVVLAAAGP